MAGRSSAPTLSHRPVEPTSARARAINANAPTASRPAPMRRAGAQPRPPMERLLRARNERTFRAEPVAHGSNAAAARFRVSIARRGRFVTGGASRLVRPLGGATLHGLDEDVGISRL